MKDIFGSDCYEPPYPDYTRITRFRLPLNINNYFQTAGKSVKSIEANTAPYFRTYEYVISGVECRQWRCTRSRSLVCL